MWRATPLTLCAWGLGALLLVLLAGCGTPGDGGGDAALVSCLSAPRRPVLVEAARSLGLAAPATDDAAAVAAWRAAHPQDFDRACAAITPPGQPDPVDTGLLALLGGLLGALVTSGSTVLVARTTRRGEVTQALRVAARQLSATTDGMLLQRRGRQTSGPSVEQLLERVAALEGALRRARPAALHPERVDASLRHTRELPAAFAGAWPQAGRPESIERASSVEQAVNVLLDDVERVASERSRLLPRRGGDGGGAP